MNLEQFSQFKFDEELYKKFDIRLLNGDLIKDKRELVQLVNDTIYRKSARTSKEKLDVLDLRDKLLKLIRYEVNNSASNTNESEEILVGTCMDMCPEKERYHRETLNLCNRYEFDDDVINYRLMVKEYSRSSADQDLPLTNELRPISILFETMLYLIDEIIPQIYLDNSEDDIFPIGDWYDFVWNRTRSIRKDIIQQRLLLNDNEIKPANNSTDLIANGLGGVIIIEQCARFHIMCAHRLCEQSSNDFDFKINEENVKNCFQSLRQYYETSSIGNNQQQITPSPNEAEFRSYIILLNLNESNILCAIQRWPSNIRNSKHVKFALNVYFAYNSRNYVRFFRLLKSTDCEYLQACILHRFFYKVRCEAFKTIFTAFKDQKERTFPLSKLNDLLGFDSDEILDYCELYGLDIEDSNVIMSTTANNSIFKLTKSNEDRLKAHRSILLVESKFEDKLSSNSWSKEKCLSHIIAGAAVQDTSGLFALDSNYELTNSFNEDGHFNSDEINQMLEYARAKRANNVEIAPVEKTKTTIPFIKRRIDGTKSAALKMANNLIKKSIKKPSFPTTDPQEGELTKRKTSTSSTSSTEAKSKSKRSEFDREEKRSKKFPEVVTRPLFKDPILTQPSIFGASKPDINPFSSFITSKLPISKEVDGPKNLFSNLVTKVNPLAAAQPLFQKSQPLFQKSQPLFIAPKPDVPKPEAVTNLFENVLTKQDQDDYASRKKKYLEQKSEMYFEALNLSIIKDLVSDFIQTHRDIPRKLSEDLLESVMQDQVKKICQEVVPLMQSYEKTKLEDELRQKKMEQKRKEEEQIYFNQINSIFESCYDGLLQNVISDFCYNFITLRKDVETNIYDDIICEVFQKEFEIIIKQVANELNNELTLDRLAESIYFNDSYFGSENNSIEQKDDEEINEASEVDNKELGILRPVSSSQINLNSIFMSDLCSCLHESIYESTRLNLNVNRELYYELKQAIALNEKKHLFRKWRLKLSIKLLATAHKRASLELKPYHRSKNSTQQINLISFIKSYGNYLVNNLNRFQGILSFMITNTADYSIVHCEQFQMHLTWDLNLNYKHYLYELLLDNYFDIIHNRDESILLPPFSLASPSSFNPNDSLDQKTITLNSHELFAKTIIVMPKLAHNDSDDLEAIKRWLMNKFFHFDSNKNAYETKHIENLFVTMLHSNAYGFRFCIKVCSSNMTDQEYETKQNSRNLYGANSMIYILAPLDKNQTIDSYSTTNRLKLLKILKLFNENLTVQQSLQLFQIMFVSYLNLEQTRQVIKLIVGDSANYLYCLLDGDVIKDNSLLQSTYQQFLHRIYRQNSITHTFNDSNQVNYEQINNILPLATIFELTIMKFFEFLTHSTTKKSIHVTLSSMIDEYNTRLEYLIRLLTPDEYKQISWPIPEFIDSDFTHDSSYSILKHWNTRECFDNVIKTQFLNLLSLDKVSIDELVDDSLEEKFLNYLNDSLKAKVINGTLPSKSECFKSVYQLESTIKNCFKKKAAKINWSDLVLAIIEYLLTNGYMTLNNKQINLDKFYFYCNLDKLKSYDWVNNCVSCSAQTSPTCSIISEPSNYMVKKYELKQDLEDLVYSQKNLKRRFSDESFEESNQSPEIEVTTQKTFSPIKQLKYQRLSTTPFKPESSNEFESKFKEFFDMLNTEKENHREFESKLNMHSIERDKVKEYLLENDVNNTNSNFETLMERLNEEKSKNEQFNTKLNQMLDF